MSEIVLCSHLPGEGYFRSKRFRAVSLPCSGDYDYSRGWQALWGTDLTIVGLEHDHDASDELVQGLLDCPHELCTWAYLLHWASTGGAAHYAQRHGGTNHGEWIRPGEEWCDFTGIGFCKIRPEARVRPLVEREWQFVDCAVTDATEGRWHVHWQRGRDGEPVGVEHHHH